MYSLRSELLALDGFAHGFFWEDEAAFPGALGVLGITAGAIHLARQVHGCAAVVVDVHSTEPTATREADAVVSATGGQACGVRVADCVPILLASRAGAAAAVHSGWRGTVLDVVGAAVRALRQVADGEIAAAIGPHIGPCCFEVGDDVAAQLSAASPLGEVVVDRLRPRPHIDLAAIVGAQLERAGVGSIETLRACTRCDPRGLPSYRRDGKGAGRLLAAIVARA